MLRLEQAWYGVMENIQWLVMAAVAIAAVAATIYFGIQNLRNVITQRERDAGYDSGRVDAKLENLEQLVRGVNENLRGVTEDVRSANEKLDVHDVLLRQIRREAKKQSRRLRKLRKRVEVLESNSPPPPTDPASSEARVTSATVVSQEGPRLAAVTGSGPAVEPRDRAM